MIPNGSKILLPSSTSSLRLAKMLRTACCLSTLLISISGCQHRTTTDTVTDWTHSLYGGEIYRLHPPTPGFDKPYLHVGRTPTSVPDFPSMDARTIITNRLESERNYAQRVGAANGPLPPHGYLNPTPLHPEKNSETTHTHQKNAEDSTSQPLPTSTERKEPPSLLYQAIDHKIPAHLPDPGEAPAPINFPGFSVPANVNAPTPEFNTTSPVGTLIHFQADTDRLTANQNQELHHIVSIRKHRPLLIRGFGTTLTAQAGLTPTDQSHEIALGLLRARAVANYLITLGVPENDIRLTAEALGDGVRITYQSP